MAIISNENWHFSLKITLITDISTSPNHYTGTYIPVRGFVKTPFLDIGCVNIVREALNRFRFSLFHAS